MHELIVKLNSGPVYIVYIVYRLFPSAIASLPLARASHKTENPAVNFRVIYTLQILQNLEFSYMQNSYCDHRNFDSVNQPLPVGIVGEIFAVLQLP